MPVIIAVMYFLLSILVGFFGKERRFGYWGYFFASLLLTPIVGLLLVWSSYPKSELVDPRRQF